MHDRGPATGLGWQSRRDAGQRPAVTVARATIYGRLRDVIRAQSLLGSSVRL
jgi:hypothetical protein